MKLNFFLIGAALLIFFSCTKDHQPVVLAKPVGCDSIEFTYANNIRPVIVANCSGPTCHSGGNANRDYSTYEVLAEQIRSGVFEERITLPDGDPLYMPQGGDLSKCDLFTLRTWIHQGFKK